MMARRRKRWVIKFGTGILSHPDGTLDHAQVRQLLNQIVALVRSKLEIILVSSGAIGAGMGIMKLKNRPSELRAMQACAAIGQPHLLSLYEGILAERGLHVAQILLTYFDLDSRTLYRNAQATIEHLLQGGRYLPIINENDAVSYEELHLKFGDNDQLSAHVATMLGANRLIILSNVRGLTRKTDGSGRVIPEVAKLTSKIEGYAGASGSQLSVGGMVSKIRAARIATSSNIDMQIANGREPNILERIASGEKIGTLFLAGAADPESAPTMR